ncbi:MAG: molybdopterin molybdotransferase MoeA [Coriobacteriia bacterium]|nr:molybdopterin molybdotransferase MoeA [Coriobacteriia bacterium]
MITVEQAREAVLARIKRLPAVEVDILDTLGRVLAADISSDIDIAPFDNSAMDGYAVRAADVAGASEESPVVLDVVEHVAAGSFPVETVGAGQATRIMTGAPMPQGADAVVMVERTEALEAGGGAGGTAAIKAPVAVGENVRLRAEDVRTGDIVLSADEVVSAAAIGLMAAMGRPKASVYRRPRVAIVATGDELVGIDEYPGPGKIRNSNSYSLAAQVLAAGGEPHILPVARDNEADTRAILSRAPEFDLMVSTGGVSMGDFDVVKDVLEDIGVMDFWKVAMRPGAPQTYGTIGGTPFFGLPGNPTSTTVGFELFVRPAMRKMAGYGALERPTVQAVLTHDVKKKSDRRYFLRGRLTRTDDGYSVALSGSQSSAMLTSMHRANCLVSLAEGESFFSAGSIVTCIRLDIEEGVK